MLTLLTSHPAIYVIIHPLSARTFSISLRAHAQHSVFILGQLSFEFSTLDQVQCKNHDTLNQPTPTLHSVNMKKR